MNNSQRIILLAILAIATVALVIQNVLTVAPDLSSQQTQRIADLKDGEYKQFTSDERLKTVVNYKNGIKHGRSYLYHEDGETVLLEMPYINGKREGVSKKYYESGQLYASTPYQNDLLHGTRTTYYSSGKLKSVVHYAYGYPGIGTEEYFIDGSKKKENAILFDQEGTTYFLDTKDNCERKRFYIGSLIEDRFYSLLDKNLKSLPTKNGRYYLDTEVYTPSFLRYQSIVCKCESTQGNPIVLKSNLKIHTSSP